MKERLLDVIKWGLILIIGGCVFYVVSPKYEFRFERAIVLRNNLITGTIEMFDSETRSWMGTTMPPRKNKGG